MFYVAHFKILDRYCGVLTGYLTCPFWLACPLFLYPSSSLSTVPQLSPFLSSPSLSHVQVSPFLFPTVRQHNK